MNKSIRIRGAVLVLLLFLTCLQLQAQGRFGFGVVFGEPTGIAMKYRIGNANAVDGAIGFSPYDRFRIHGDYLWQSYPFQTPNLALHYGIGAAFGFGRAAIIYSRPDGGYFLRRVDLGFGVRTVIGLTYAVARSPVDVFLEFAPIFIFAPGPDVGFDIGLGARFYPNG